jgi:ADP-heptose:LPS heptosyltransferase
MNILVTRTDRLGDVILATPVLRHLRLKHPEARIYFLVNPAWASVLAFGSEVRLILDDPGLGVEKLSQTLREYRFDLAYILKDEARVSKAIKRAGIPKRVGPYSSLRSFFLFNKGKLQRRSRCEMHEAEYNLDLVDARMPALTPEALPRAWITTSPEARIRALEFLAKSGLQEKKFWVIHPGSSGSARYIPQQHLYDLANRLIRRGDRVVISGGPAELQVLMEFKKAVPEVTLLGPEEQVGLDGMAEVYRLARAVVAHGTGPLHLAAAVQTPVLAIFPPLFVLSEKRWGPLVSPRSVWTPSVLCPEKFKCRGEKCRFYDCMDLFRAETTIHSLEALIP